MIMRIIKMDEFPFHSFGSNPPRKVRLPISPETSGDRMTMTYVVVPPNGISEGHVHPDTDEYIYFDIGGAVIIDGVRIELPSHSIALAQAGEKHECINVSSSTELRLLCIYVPPMKLSGNFLELAEKTKAFLKGK
jgi:quercetin dioxygenase-like cupin family protein